jgi:DNA-binding NtrC family response regulator
MGARMGEEHVWEPGGLKRRVLLVEDDPDVRKALGRSIRLHGFEVAEAGSVAAATVILESSPPDVLLVDRDMGPGLTGWDLGKAWEWRIRVVRMSGDDWRGVDYFRKGMDSTERLVELLRG